MLHCVLCVPTIYPATALQEVKQPSKKRSPDQADKKLILGKYRTLEEVPREVQYITVQYSTVQYSTVQFSATRGIHHTTHSLLYLQPGSWRGD